MNTAQEPAKLIWAEQWLKSPKGHYINGEWILPNVCEAIETIDPATGRVLAKLPVADSAVVDRAVQAARRIFDTSDWPRIPRRDRTTLLREITSAVKRHHAELATLEALDNGKTYREAFWDDIPEAADVFDYYGGWTDKLYGESVPVEDGFVNYTTRRPVGVCALIVPWNFPLLLAAWKLAPALAMGNTVVIKPSSSTSLSLIRFLEILDKETSLPKGVINLILGSGDTGMLLARHPAVNKISFTGSTSVGKKLVHAAADSNLKTVTLELGGKSPNIIFEDVPDLEFAIERSFAATFSHKGEKCSEPTRLFVHEQHYDHVLGALVERANKIVCGDPFSEKTNQGAQCTQAHMENILRYIEIGRQEGAEVVAGGIRDINGSNSRGFFVRPTLFADAKNQMRIAQEEIFGPVLTVHRFRDEEDVVRQANDTIYGLAAGFWTKDVSRAHRVAEKLQAGMVFVNRYGCYDFASPFGGLKQSGWGKEMGRHALDAYTQVKSIWIKI